MAFNITKTVVSKDSRTPRLDRVIWGVIAVVVALLIEAILTAGTGVVVEFVLSCLTNNNWAANVIAAVNCMEVAGVTLIALNAILLAFWIGGVIRGMFRHGATRALSPVKANVWTAERSSEKTVSLAI